MEMNVKNTKLIRKVDEVGEDWLGRIHADDLAVGVRSSRWLLKNASTQLLFEIIGSYSRENTSEGWNIPSGSDFPLRFKTLSFTSRGVGVVCNGVFDTFQITREGLYFVEGFDAVDIPVVIQPSYAYLKLKRNSNVYRILDGVPMVSAPVGTGSSLYHHFWVLHGGTFVWFNKNDKFQIILEFGSEASPPQGLTTSNIHTCYFSIHYLGDGYEPS
jgi:hypothetical protein